MHWKQYIWRSLSIADGTGSNGCMYSWSITAGATFLCTEQYLCVHNYNSSSAADTVPLCLFIVLLERGLFYAMLNMAWIKYIHSLSKEIFSILFLSFFPTQRRHNDFHSSKKLIYKFLILTALKNNEIMEYSKILLSEEIRV